MEFIKIAYCISVAVLLLLIRLTKAPVKKYSINVLAVSNLLLIGHSVFLVRQLLGAYQLAQKLSIDYRQFLGETNFRIRILLLIFLPLLSLLPYFRKHLLFSLFLAALLYSVYPFYSWNTYDLLFKIPAYLCLLCAGYALLWLLNKLPYQSRVT